MTNKLGHPCVTILLAVIVMLSPAARGESVSVTRLTPELIEYKIYTDAGTKTVSLDGLVLWDAIPPGDDPTNHWWSYEPDFRIHLLQKGLARLKAPGTAEPSLREAEQKARSEKLGMWAPPPPAPTPSPSTSDIAEPQPEPPVADTSSATTSEGGTETPPTPWIPSLRQFGVAIVTFFGGWQLLLLVWAYFHRHRVYLVLLGEPNTGKSWLWRRLVDPTASEIDIRQVLKSDAIARLKRSKIGMGKFEIVPIYTDVPGNQAGEQLSQLIDRKWFRLLQRLFFPQRRVWVILLAPTTNDESPNAGDFGSIDRDDLNKQLGALKLYVGVLASKKTPKPDFVAICIAKADRFMTQAPNDTQSKAAHDQLITIFKDHITFLQTACKDREVPHVLVVCSALKGWGSKRILEALHMTCYASK